MINFADDIRTDVLQLRADRLAGGTLTLYTAPKPAIGAAITTQTALVTVNIPGGLAVSNNLLTLLLSATAIAADGVAAWGRLRKANGDFAADGDCGLLAESDKAFRLRSLTLISGGQLIPILATLAEA